ncbi:MULTISPECIES: LacI family DNA-binding transcriptional regulator [Peptoniphilus]|jgi:HTH-type transcriptional regulator regA|uniref:LacI family DNA-binding transcriptional regulator n=1 Tax=Peptoniphilus TaxID=162289 RepID=UPI0008DAC6ED|nr:MULTISPECIES: LacI family DNA-binding transcriptional regulator [Peptoniphilus]MBS6611358.1 LacI family DNA-binding transcriptional regulator [Peptoniphilus harei]MDU1955207.1 LacI family DNA-binding transcriptional regulator [Peptoniphilus lacydonensis]MDU2116062.1 LacI family DNA-binding transcriptional regulator [Peptoniphilus lacydonensis]MDU5275452.1 LacI family DNA-binding transcriptional regulator [Peptoniphilus lacydonensis]MDU5378140.1 LacI family DNA-binding transcriptional regula
MASTIKDVAKMADVSISTVSRVINDSKPVSPEARRRVLHAIEVLDYKPNEVARSLVTKKSNLIGVIVEDIGSNFISQILRGVEEVGRMYKYDILLSSSYGDPESEMKFANLLAQKQVEGIIVISNLHNPKLEYKLEESKIPYVVISNFYDIEKFSATIDYEKASYDMVSYLISKGHKNIASLGIRKDIDRTFEKKKIEGYNRAMEEHGLKKVNMYVEGLGEEFVKSEEDTIIETVKKEKITAIFASYDTIAIHLINLLLDNNYKTPDDISVTGFGGSYISNIYRPKVTTVKIPYYDIGAVSIRKILKKIAKEDDNLAENVVLPSEILERESVKILND